jgi:proteic killer suppression protein
MLWRQLIKISWSDRKLEKACTRGAAGQRRWGANHWALLKRRIASLEAASTLQEMAGVPGRMHGLHGDRRGQFALCLWGSYRLVFAPDHNPIPTLPDGVGIDQAQVTDIRIIEIVDYHGR